MAGTSRPVQRSFIGGEQSPRLGSRADLERFQISVAAMENFIVFPQGGGTRRPGLQCVADAILGSRLITFEFSDSDGYAIEFGPLVARFYRDYAVLMNGAAPYELVTPFSSDDAGKIVAAQAADQVFLATGVRPLQKLKRLSELNWTIAAGAFTDGPFLDENTDETITVSTTEVGELVKDLAFPLIASAAIFEAAHVGSLWKIAIKDQSLYPVWSAGTDVDLGQFRYWDGNLYKCTGSAQAFSGSQPPVHLTGEAWDGSYGPAPGSGTKKWLYLHSGYGVVKVTAYVSPTQVTVQAQSYVPKDLFTGTWRWSEGAWSDKRGYPKVVAFHDQRLLAASTSFEPAKIWASEIGNYESMRAAVEDTAAFNRALLGNNKVNAIRWMVSGQRLDIGTAGDEFSVQASSAREPLTPDNVIILPATTEGSANVPALRVDDPLFLSKTGKRVHRLEFASEADGFVAPDLTIFAEHITGPGGVVAWTWQREPLRILWCVRSDGLLIGMTYRKDHNIIAWHRHPMPDARVLSVAAVPSPNGKRQDLWLIVERDLPTGLRRFVECMRPIFEEEYADAVTAFEAEFLDCAIIYNNPALPITEVTGLSHLNGSTVQVFADGAVQTETQVIGGAITLDRIASKVVVGLPMTSLLTTLRYDPINIGGVIAGRKVRPAKVVAELLRSAGIECWAENLAGVKGEMLKPAFGGGAMDSSIALRSGTFEIEIPADWEYGGSVTLKTTLPFPATVLAITPIMQVAS